MANGPLGGFMPTPAAPSQPPSVKIETTADSRGAFTNFLKNINGAPNPPQAPMGATMPLQMAPSVSEVDIFNEPVGMQFGGEASSPLAGYGDYLAQKIDSTQVEPFIQEVEQMANQKFNLNGGSDSGGQSVFGPLKTFDASQPSMEIAEPLISPSMFQGAPQQYPQDLSRPKMEFAPSSGEPLLSIFDSGINGFRPFNPPQIQDMMARPVDPLKDKDGILREPMGLRGGPNMFNMIDQRIFNEGFMPEPAQLTGGFTRAYADGGEVPPRNLDIMGQPHMLAYITPGEGDLLESLGGANEPGPMGIPSFYETSEESEGTDAAGDPSGGVDGPSGEAGGGSSSDPSGSSPDDDSAPDDDMDYTDVDYGYTTPDDTGKTDMDIATEIGQAVSQAQANAAEIQNRALAAKTRQNVQAAITQKAVEDMKGFNMGLAKGSTTPGAMVGGPPQGSGTTISNVAGAATTNFSNIGTKGLADDPLGLSLEGVGLGPDISTPSISSVSPTSGPNTNADITGFGSKKDKSDFSTDIDALSDVEDQAKKGSFPALDKFGLIGRAINSITKSRAQNTIDNISKGFTPTYDKDGNITGTGNYGIGMGQPGGLFGGGKSVEGYDVFNDTSPSMGMYSDTADIGGDDSSDPIIRKRILPIEEEEEDKPPNVIGGGVPVPVPEPVPTVVDSPFGPSSANIQPINFDTGDLNKLIEMLTGVPAKPIISKKEGGLVSAVDDFLSSFR